ncbi:polysaccharide deacetylase [Streptomyces sp. NPDC001508]|uniref:polysaccharide deacetylase family protein n=1 Tax=Streptomyces sp. NPDC001508 TaxID=3154656 RepID=UPI0033218A0A
MATVCLSFDFDAISVWAGTLGLTSPQYISRGEYGANIATPRILDVLDREELSTTWFIPGMDAENHPEVCKRIRDNGHEIGHHGYAHESPTALSPEQERTVLERGFETLDSVLGVRPTGYRSPAFDLTEVSTQILSDMGFDYDSSLMANDFQMYRTRTGDVIHRDRASEFGRTLDLVEAPVSWTLDDFPFTEFVMSANFYSPASTDVEAMAQRWLDDLDFMMEQEPDGYFIQTFHPQAIGRGSRLRILERVIKRGKDHGVTFSTIQDAVNSWRRDNIYVATGAAS